MISIQKVSCQDCWPIRHQVMWPDRSLDYVKLPEDEKGEHFGLYKEKDLIAVISFFIQNQQAQFRKFACLVEEQGKGYGSQLLQFILEEISQKQIDRVFCNARVEKAAYYEKFGLVKTSEFFEKGGKSYVIMEKWNK